MVRLAENLAGIDENSVKKFSLKYIIEKVKRLIRFLISRFERV